MNQARREEKAPAEQSDLTLATGKAMTKHMAFRRACSLRAPKSPGLLDQVPGSLYGCLEEAPLPWEAEGAPWRADRSLGPGHEEASQEAARKKGSCGRRALSLKGRDRKDEEATLAGEASDGQLLIGQAHGSNRVKQCQKVNRALQRGWQGFLANMHRLPLMRLASLPTSRQ